MYLGDWKDTGFIGMVADFEGIYMSPAEYEATQPVWPNATYWYEAKASLTAALAKPEYQNLEVLLGFYAYEDYSGEAFVLFRRDGQLFEVNASHCSCYGLEETWDPEATTVAELLHRLDRGRLGQQGWEDPDSQNRFAAELRGVLAGLGPV